MKTLIGVMVGGKVYFQNKTSTDTIIIGNKDMENENIINYGLRIAPRTTFPIETAPGLAPTKLKAVTADGEEVRLIFNRLLTGDLYGVDNNTGDNPSA